MGGLAAMAIGEGLKMGAQIGGMALQNHYNKKENARQREFAKNQFEDDWIYRRQATDLAWQRDNDWQFKMSQWNKAGLNPYAMLGNSFQAPASVSGSSTPSVNPHYTDFQGGFRDVANNIQTAIQNHMQLKMMDADIRQKEADAELKKADAEGKTIDNQFKPLEKYVGIENTQAITQNYKQTTDNLKASKDLIINETALKKEQTKGQMIANDIAAIESRYAEKKNELIQASMELANKKTQADIDVLQKQLSVMDQTIAKMKSDIEVNKGNVELMAQTVSKYKNEIERENELRPYDKKSIERSNLGLGAPIMGAMQFLDGGAKGDRTKKYQNHYQLDNYPILNRGWKK